MIDVNSAAWKVIEARLHERLSILRRELERDLDPTATARARGGIAELTDLLGFALLVPAKADPIVPPARPDASGY